MTGIFPGIFRIAADNMPSVAGSNTVFLLVLTKRIQALHVLNFKSTFLFPAQILKARNRQFSNFY